MEVIKQPETKSEYSVHTKSTIPKKIPKMQNNIKRLLKQKNRTETESEYSVHTKSILQKKMLNMQDNIEKLLK